MNESFRNTVRTLLLKETFVILELLCIFLSIFLIAKSTTVSVPRDLYIDHRFSEPSARQHGAEHNISLKKGKTTNKYNNLRNQSAISICFVADQFSSSRNRTGNLFDVRETTPRLYNSPLYRFFAFSDLADLKIPGWEVVVKDLRGYKRWTTQSRWAKFLAFRHPTIQKACEVVFYMDGMVLSPMDNPQRFQAESRRILNSPLQLAQRLHPLGGGAEEEFGRILSTNTDSKKNVDASLKWLRAQKDYDKNCILYETSFFGYGIDSAAFQKAAYFFWHHYSKEDDSWEDQSLWCYTLDHFHLTPLQLTGNGKDVLFEQVHK